jgi:HK97 family phage major capsid protein
MFDEIKAEIESLEAKVASLTEVPDEDLTDEIVEQFKSSVDELEKKSNELKTLEASYESERAEIAAKLSNPEITEENKTMIPKTALGRTKLEAFESEESAYAAGMFFASNMFGNKKAGEWLSDSNYYAADLNTKDDLKGGLFVPAELENSIVRLVEEYGVFRKWAKVSPMASDRKVVPVRRSGMTAYAVSETDTANEGSNTGTRSNPEYDQVELVARKWKAWLKVSDELNEDSAISLAEEIVKEMAQAFAYAEDNAGFNGDGTSTHHGIVGLKTALNAGSKLVTSSGELAFSDLVMADFEQVVGMLPQYPGINPVWFVSKPGYYASMENLKNALGGVDGDEIGRGHNQTFLGYPVVFSNAMHKGLTDSASTPLVYFGDLSMAALFGDRRGVSLSTTSERFWDEDVIAMKASERFDINIHSRGDASDAGAVCSIVTAAS